MNHGFIKVAAAIPNVKVADCTANAESILKLIQKAVKKDVEIICFPELSITASTCGDLFHNQLLIDEAENSLTYLLEATRWLPIICLVGMPVRSGNQLVNAAVVFQSGSILAVFPKKYVVTDSHFIGSQKVQAKEVTLCGQVVPMGIDIVLIHNKVSFSAEISEDFLLLVPPSYAQSLAGSQLIFNLASSFEVIGKHEANCMTLIRQSARCAAGYVYTSAGFGESTTDLVFSGSCIIAENGSIIAEGERFLVSEQLLINDIDIERIAAERLKNDYFKQDFLWSKDNRCRYVSFELSNSKSFELTRTVPALPFVPAESVLDKRCREILNIQTNALATRIKHTGINKMVVGVSGGLDSTLALMVCVGVCYKLDIPRKNIIGITMPGFGTTTRTHTNAALLIEKVGATLLEINIKDACLQHFKDIGHPENKCDVTYQNTQARERTQILMDIANQVGGIMVGTGDMSELALGWTTYGGDHLSMYAVNAGVPKTLTRHLVKWIATNKGDNSLKSILLDIINTPISPELLPTDKANNSCQPTEELVGPYELHDFFLYYMLRFGFRPTKIYFLAQKAFAGKYEESTIKSWLKVFISRFFSQQFKRSCLPDGPRIGSIGLSPRGEWNMPSDASAELWLKDLENL